MIRILRLGDSGKKRNKKDTPAGLQSSRPSAMSRKQENGGGSHAANRVGLLSRLRE